MVQEEIVIQTANEVSNIDYARETNNLIAQQQSETQSNMEVISNQLVSIKDAIVNNGGSGDTTSNTNLSEVTSLIENIDTTVVESQNQDILDILDSQQAQLDDIKEKINLIVSKLE